MRLLGNINSYIKNNIGKIFLVILLLNPVFDLVTSLSINIVKLEFNFIIIIKILIMFLFIYYLFFLSKSKYKKISIIYILTIFMYMLLFLITTIKVKDSNVVSYELQNIIRCFFFPINLVCLFNMSIDNKIRIERKHLIIILSTYIILLIIPTITKTDFNSYSYSKEGSVGWFNSTNEIGAILSILLPFGINYLFKIKNKILMILILIFSLYTYFSLGTKVPILSLGIIILIFLLKYTINSFQKKQIKRILIIFILFVSSIISGIIIIPKTSFYKNIIIHLDFLEVKSINDLTNTHIIDHLIFSERISFFEKTKKNYLDSTTQEKFLGIGYIEKYNTLEENNKTIEMDYYDIFFRNGIIGFVIYFIPYIYVLYKIIKRSLKTKLDNNLLALYLSIFLIIILSFFSGHVIVSPSVSILVATILIMTLNKLEVINENSIFNN